MIPHQSCAFHRGRGSSSKECPAPSVEDRTPVHPSWQLSLNSRPKQTNIATLYVSMTGPLCGWTCLRKGNGSRCCGSRASRTVMSLAKRYSTATLRDDQKRKGCGAYYQRIQKHIGAALRFARVPQKVGWSCPEASPPRCSSG